MSTREVTPIKERFFRIRSKNAASRWNLRKSAWSILLFVIGILVLVLFFHYDAHRQLSQLISSWGIFGVLLSILLMALFCAVPVPSEFLLMMDMKIFGVWLGVLYAWIGSLVGSYAIFIVSRYFGRALVKRMVSQERFEQIETWVYGRGTTGLFIVRLLPIPAFVINYAAGLMEPIKWWPYMWTAGVTIIPYYLGAALIFLGVAKRLTLWFTIGSVALVAVWLTNYWLARHFKNKTH